MQKFYKGRTNNHLTWVMVDATDFATPESALSAATKIKIYGKLRSGTGVNFVSSGTGSLTNDITHVGASALGLYTIALAKADLSDASAAWYDQYIISLSATGAAYQTLIVDGGIDDSDILSQTLLILSAASDAASAAAQTNSRVLINQSRVSDIQSYLVAMSSTQSDIYSQLSDFRSDLGSLITTTGVQLNASMLSDLRSAISAGPAATVTASDISDIASAVWANAIGARVDSRVLLNLSRVSDIQSYLVAMSGSISDTYSQLSDFRSDLGSLITTTGVQLNASSLSDLRSAITAITATVSASDMSDIASRVDVLLTSRLSDILSAAQQANSRVLVTQSMVSDVYSSLSNALSGPMTASDLSDIASAVWAHTIGARVDSRVLLNQSRISDIYSLLSDVASDMTVTSAVISNIYSLLSDANSDLASKIGNISVTLTASDISDIASAVAAAAGTLTASEISDIASAVWANTIGARVDSRVLLNLSRISDAQSALTVVQSMASDAASAAQQANSRILVTQSIASDVQSAVALVQSMASDTYSLLSDVASDLTVTSGVISDIYSNLAAGVTVGASSQSDIVSAVWAKAGADPTAVPAVTATMQAKIDWLTALSRNKITQTATVQSLRNDADGADIASAAVSDDGTTFTRGEFA